MQADHFSGFKLSIFLFDKMKVIVVNDSGGLDSLALWGSRAEKYGNPCISTTMLPICVTQYLKLKSQLMARFFAV